MFSVEAQLKNIDIKSSMDENAVVYADVERVNQVLLNVIRKSVRLADRGSSIEVDCWTEIEDYEGLLFFTVSIVGDTVTPDEK